MARLQFGQSYCQIEGTYVPVADFNLVEGEGVYFAHHLAHSIHRCSGYRSAAQERLADGSAHTFVTR